MNPSFDRATGFLDHGVRPAYATQAGTMAVSSGNPYTP
jgi:hypothetical protein